MTVGFGIAEYTLVFRRAHGRSLQHQLTGGWTVVRPQAGVPRRGTPHHLNGTPVGVAEILAVPICSTLGLEGTAYEQFLLQSGVLDEVVCLLAEVDLTGAHSLDTVRKQVQSVVMAAEVRHIVDGMSA